jgi:molybdate transport system ATP-binding protein
MVFVSHQLEEILRLATHVALMESGAIVAAGGLGEISLRPEFRAIVGPEGVGAVIEGRVTQVDTERGMADVEVGGGTLHASIADARVGARMRIQLLARDIILATEPPRGLSVRNALRGVITELSDDVGQAILVRIDIGAGTAVLARVTRSAREALGLEAGRAVWVLIKAVSARGHTYAAGALG